jgi:probable HAF family extracellular repeat protein
MSKKLALVLVAVAVPIEAQNANTHYSIINLQTLGGNSSEALSINDAGVVAGDSCVDATTTCTIIHPFIWTPARGLQDLGTLSNGGIYGLADGVNNSNQVVGSSDFAGTSMGTTHAFLWTTSGMEDLGTLGCPATAASGINLSGQVVGVSTVPVGVSTVPPCLGGGRPRAFRWTRVGGMENLGTLPGGTFSVGNAINAVGQIVGYADPAGLNGTGYHAFVWDSGVMHDLGVLPGGSFSAALGIGDSGVVVGVSDSGQTLTHAVMWSAQGNMLDLGTLPGGSWSGANAINASGLIVGSSDAAASASHGFQWGRNRAPVSNDSHAFIWSEKRGMQDLNDLIVPAQSGWTLVDARGINSCGQIAGTGRLNGKTRAVILNPIGQPCNTPGR